MKRERQTLLYNQSVNYGSSQLIYLCTYYLAVGHSYFSKIEKSYIKIISIKEDVL